MIKVLHYIGCLHYGGAQAFLMELYRNIDRDKVQFDFVVFPEEEKDFYDEVKNTEELFMCVPNTRDSII